jgi:hypothetical protein
MPTRFVFIFIVSLVACRPRGDAAANPGNPAPVAEPAVGATEAPQAAPPAGGETRDNTGAKSLPGRADEAPLVRVEDALSADSLLGHRVRVSGRCIAAGAGRRAGSWTLEDNGESIEVRGLVPSSCRTHSPAGLTIFAQIEPTGSGSKDRLLLRLPD